MQDEKWAIVKNIPDELSYWICTSDGSDKAKILEMEAKFPYKGKLQIFQKLAYGEDFEFEAS